MRRTLIANILELNPLSAAISSHVDIDRHLVDRFQAGDRDAFTALYRAHNAAVFRFVLNMTADPVKAAEITQDVFVWLMQHPAKFDPDRGRLPAFLVGVARKLLQRRQRSESRWLPFDDALAAPDSSLDLTRAIDAETLRKLIASLPIRYREALVLCDLESKTYEEAATILNCAVGTIRSRLHRGRELLARRFHTLPDQIPTPPDLELILLSKLETNLRHASRWFYTWSPAAAWAICLAVTTGIFHHRPVSRTVAEELFVERPFIAPLAPYERTTIVQMDLPIAALIAAGFEVHTADAGQVLRADVLFGQDGRAHALRLINQNPGVIE